MPAREEILSRLKSAKRGNVAPRPPMPVLTELSLNKEQMIQRFTAELSAQTGIVHQAANKEDVLRILKDIAAAEGLKKVITSSEKTIKGLDIKAWGSNLGIGVSSMEDFADKEAFRDQAFDADAGITSADFAIAETGTLGISFSKEKPRLVSIAPPIHVAIVPVKRLYPVYEKAIESVFKNESTIPSQFCFITGPSSTADIHGIHFKGMHGPTKVIVILIMGQG